MRSLRVMQRRTCLITLGGLAACPLAMPAEAGMRFPADFGAHPQSRTEWWYITGSLQHGEREIGRASCRERV